MINMLPVDLCPRFLVSRLGRRASRQHFLTSGPLPARSFAVIAPDGTFEILRFAQSLLEAQHRLYRLVSERQIALKIALISDRCLRYREQHIRHQTGFRNGSDVSGFQLKVSPG